MPGCTHTIGFYGVANLEVLHRSLTGVLRYAAEVGGFQVRDFRVSPAKDMANLTPPVWRGQVDGVVLSIGRFEDMTDKQTADWVLSGGVPAVSVAADWQDVRVPCFHVQSESLGKLAAKHLVDGGCKSFLYVGYAGSAGSQNRADAFASALAQQGKRLQRHDMSVRLRGLLEDAALVRTQTKLGTRLRRLKKPVGVWALNDIFARGVCVLCDDLGLSIPGDVKVLGVGDTRTARNHHPSLSSIHTPGEEVGYLAMRTLHTLLRGERRPRRPTQVPATELVVRVSTAAKMPASADFQAVVDYVARHACSGVTVEHLVERMNISRRSFELKFQTLVGRSPGEEIQRVRLERAKELLLQTRLSITRITSMVGFLETATFSKFFRKLTGVTPSDYRAASPLKARRRDERAKRETAARKKREDGEKGQGDCAMLGDLA